MPGSGAVIWGWVRALLPHKKIERKSIMKIGPFNILGTLGTGAHSTILKIRRDSDPKTYALKVVQIDDPEEDLKYKAQVEHEWEVLNSLDHPNILKGYTLEVIKDWFFRVKKLHLLLEYVPGQPLDNAKGLNIPRTVEVFQKVAAAMVHMHRRGIFHADLKPNNIMLAPGGVLKVIDFGLAHIKGTEKGRVQGTPEFIAPETVKQKVVNERTDIFNFGATMYRMFTWKVPPTVIGNPETGGLLDVKLWQNQLKPARELKPALPENLANLIHSCMSFLPGGRPERFGEILSELEQIREALPSGPDDTLENMDAV
jgi:serine/threonine protein kinase